MQREGQYYKRPNFFFTYRPPMNIINYIQRPFGYGNVSPNNPFVENRNSHPTPPIEKNSHDHMTERDYVIKERNTFPVVNVSTDVLKEAFFLPKQIISIQKSMYNSQSSDQDTTNTTLNQTEESSARNSINNTGMTIISNFNLGEDALAYNNNNNQSQSQQQQQDEYTTPEIKHRIGNQTNHCISPMMISNFNLYDNQQRQQTMYGFSRRFSQNYQGEALNTSMINYNNENDIKKSSTMKSPFNNHYNSAHQSMFFNATQSCSGIQSPKEENTEILSVYVRINPNENVVFVLKRYDDLFKTIKFFCEINKIDERLIKPMILRTLEAINQTYQAMNCPLNNDDKLRLEYIRANHIKCKYNEEPDIIKVDDKEENTIPSS